MIQAAPFILPIAEALGLSVATLGMAKVTDEVNKYIEENPEQAQKLLTIAMPVQGIATMFKGDDDNLPEKIDEDKKKEEPPEDPDFIPEILKLKEIDDDDDVALDTPEAYDKDGKNSKR
jgi:ABC-type nitrate/sulfonate/bicarbonate transport system substrate-binding protein